MKKILLLLVFVAMAGIPAVHAFDFDEQGGFYSPQVYPYPPVQSLAIKELPAGFDTIILGNETYYYYQGAFYQKIVRDDAYLAVSPPIGAVVFSLPDGYQYMYANGRAFYVFNGIYYKWVLNGYKVIPPPEGL